MTVKLGGRRNAATGLCSLSCPQTIIPLHGERKCPDRAFLSLLPSEVGNRTAADKPMFSLQIFFPFHVRQIGETLWGQLSVHHVKRFTQGWCLWSGCLVTEVLGRGRNRWCGQVPPRALMSWEGSRGLFKPQEHVCFVIIFLISLNISSLKTAGQGWK